MIHPAGSLGRIERPTKYKFIIGAQRGGPRWRRVLHVSYKKENQLHTKKKCEDCSFFACKEPPQHYMVDYISKAFR